MRCPILVTLLCCLFVSACASSSNSKLWIEKLDVSMNSLSLTHSVAFMFLYDANSHIDRSKLNSIRQSFDQISHSASYPFVVFAFSVKEKHTVDFLLSNHGKPVLDQGFKDASLYHFKNNKWSLLNSLIDIQHAAALSKFMQRKLDLFAKSISKQTPQDSSQTEKSPSSTSSGYSAKRSEQTTSISSNCRDSQCQQPTDALSAASQTLSTPTAQAVNVDVMDLKPIDIKKYDVILSDFLKLMSSIQHAPPLPPDFPQWADSAFNMFAQSAEFYRMHNLTVTMLNLFEAFDRAVRDPNQADQIDELKSKCLSVLEDITKWEMRVRGMKFGHLYLNQTRLVHTIVVDALKIAKSTLKPIHKFFVSQQQKLQQRLQKDVSSFVPMQLADMKLKYELLRSFRGEGIPRVVHFMKTDSRSDFFLLVHYLSIRSASVRIKPDIIKFHCVVEPNTALWRKLKAETPELQVLVGTPPTKLNGKILVDPAHISDAWRMDILIAEGGIYLDWDVIVVRSFDSLLNANVILGAEIRNPQFGDALGVAVMMCRPQEPFMIRWRTQMNIHFDASKCYACHTIQLARYLSEHHPGEIHILPERAFYEPGWELHAAKYLYDTLPPSSKADEMDGAFAVHLFESHENVKFRLHALTESSIRTVHSNFNHLVRSLLA